MPLTSDRLTSQPMDTRTQVKTICPSRDQLTSFDNRCSQLLSDGWEVNSKVNSLISKEGFIYFWQQFIKVTEKSTEG